MKIVYFSFILIFFIFDLSSAQDGKIISKEPLVLNDEIWNRFRAEDSFLRNELKHIDFYRITYLSDGLKVTAYLAEPKTKGKYPCIISNRGGNRENGQWNYMSMAFMPGRMA